MIAVPTRELSGQVLASESAREHVRSSTPTFGTSTFGSVTSARLSAASSGSNVSVVPTGGTSPLCVAAGDPMKPVAFGENPSDSHPVGVIEKVFSENAEGASQELARLSEVPSAQEV